MKIAILHSGDLQGVSPGGVDRYVKSIILGFEDGEITLFGTTSPEQGVALGKKYERIYEGRKYYFIPISYDTKSPLCIYYAKNLLRHLRALQLYDCVYAQRIEYTLPFILSPLKKKVIQLIHGSSAYSEIGFGKKIAAVYPWFERVAIGIAARTYIVLNRDDFGVPYYKRHYPQYADKIHYGRNPVDCAFYEMSNRQQSRKELGFNDSDFIVSFVGRISDNPKRVMSLPGICSKVVLEKPLVKFVVVGDGDDLDNLKRLVSERKLSEYFIFTGYLSDSESIKRYISSSDATINISFFEGTCTSVLESLACGVSVLSTDVGDIHEVVKNGRNGLVIPNDSETIEINAAKALISMVDNPVEMGTEYRQYDLSNVVSELRRDMEEIEG